MQSAVNEAIVDYTSPALCKLTPVTPFSPIGDAAYRQLALGCLHSPIDLPRSLA